MEDGKEMYFKREAVLPQRGPHKIIRLLQYAYMSVTGHDKTIHQISNDENKWGKLNCQTDRQIDRLDRLSENLKSPLTSLMD